MVRIYGFDVGTTSIGFAVIDYDAATERGEILRLGVRIFPEARDADGTPLNQQRRAKRMMRRQLRRRRQRRRALNEQLCEAGLLPRFDKDKNSEWSRAMKADPYDLRRRGLTEPLSAFEIGRALYNLAKRRHFKGRDIEDEKDADEIDAEERKSQDDRDSTLAALNREGMTLGAWLAARKADATKGTLPQERRRGVHATRAVIEKEFEKLWQAQEPHHPRLRDSIFKAAIRETIFFQRPVFWRKNTLGHCRFMPEEALCPKGSWLSQQCRMLEKLNNLALAGGNQRTLDPEERTAILEKLQMQASMSWTDVRAALRPLYAARDEKGAEKSLRFNLELGGEKKLLGNAVEAKLARIFGSEWASHPHKQAIRDAVHARLWSADYGETLDGQRVVILSEAQRRARRAVTARSFMTEFGLTAPQAATLQELTFPTGWEPFSTAALRIFLPKLEAGVRMGDLLNGADNDKWREALFPNRERPTGEFCEQLPSPADKAEQVRIAALRNPTVGRVQNELRKVVNNLLRAYGKPDLIRVELAREVGKSKRERETDQNRMRERERERKKAIADLQVKGIPQPAREDIEKWLLWKECGQFDPYSGKSIGFDDLFRNNVFQVEHIWPRSESLDDSFMNKTLCHRDWNARKHNRLPYDAFGGTDEWEAMNGRMWKHVEDKRMAKAKAARFSRTEPLPKDFASRQLNDTGYAARQSVAFLKRLWPDIGPEAPVRVQTVSGRVTAQLRRLWCLNNILGDTGEKTRADHRHHAVDALVVACAHPGVTQKLSRFWQEKENPWSQRPLLPAPWPTIRADGEKAVGEIVVSHRVRKKISGPLHDEMPLGCTGREIVKGSVKLGIYVKRIPVEKVTLECLKIGDVDEISKKAKFVVHDKEVRKVLLNHIKNSGGDPKRAFPPYPRVGIHGPEIRKIRVLTTQQRDLMVPVTTGYADPANNHHIAIYRKPDGKIESEVVTLFKAAGRLAKHEAVVRRDGKNGSTFMMSLVPGDAIELLEGDRKGIWIVQGIWANRQIVLERASDAAHATTIQPMVSTLIKDGVRKVSVDPIGRVRRARD